VGTRLRSDLETHPLLGALVAEYAVLLQAEEVRLVHALDPEEGYRVARSEQPDLILLDVRMPGSDGFEVCHRLKANLETADAAVIFLSAAEDTETKVRGFDLGAVDYVVKPFEAPELRARVRAALRTQRYLGLLAREARIDGLTGLGNRRYLQDALDRAMASARRRSRGFCLVMVDVDHFKRLNDRFGHPFGDLVLQHLGAVLRAAVRGEDVACRYGGEEFALLLLDADLEQAAVVCDRVHAGLAAMGIAFEGQAVPVTASLGVASCIGRLDGPSPASEILEAADQALYAAKESGRNRTCVG
jgi:two-component system, cell cycle response regulator